MLSRGASDSGNRVRRSKSAASVNPRCPNHTLERINDPETARQHALTAAHIAMDRANQRASAENRTPTELSRHSHRETRVGLKRSFQSENIHFRNGTGPHRQGSMLQSKSPKTPFSAPIFESHSYPHLSHAGPDPSLSEFGIFDSYASLPSSYKRLRKTRSLLTPRNQSRSIPDLTVQTYGTPRTLRHVRSALDDQEHGLRLSLKRSMSVLKLNRGNLSRPLRRSQSAVERHDPAIEQARGRLVREGEQQRTQAVTLAFSAAKAQPHNTPLNSPGSDYPTRNCGSGQSEQQQQRTKDKSRFRTFSASLKESVRRLLGRPSGEDGNLPIQQLHASRLHFGDYLDSAQNQGCSRGLENDFSSSISRRSLYRPSWQRGEPGGDFEALTNRLRSMHSSDSLRSNGHSRVTSWTNSTMTNSVPNRGTPVERQRLSIIQEHGGPHQSSASARQHIEHDFSPHVPLGPRHGNAHRTRPIDSQRVYSALIKRIDQEQGRQDCHRASQPGAGQVASAVFSSDDDSFQTCPPIRRGTGGNSTPFPVTDDRHAQSRRHTLVNEEAADQEAQKRAQECQTVEAGGFGQSALNTQCPASNFSCRPIPSKPNPTKLDSGLCHEQHVSSDDDSKSVIITRPDYYEDAYEIGSESQYSCTLSGQVPMIGNNQSQLGLSDDLTGMTTIMNKKVNDYQRPLLSQASVHARSGYAIEGRFGINAHDGGHHIFGTSTSHYREGAQIDGDDTAVGGRPLPSTPTRQSSSRILRYGIGLKEERFSTSDLQGLPRNNVPVQRQSLSLTKRKSGAVRNDENARFSSCASTHARNMHSLTSNGPELAFDGEEPPRSVPGRLPTRHQPYLSKKRSLGQSKDVTRHMGQAQQRNMMEGLLKQAEKGIEYDIVSGDKPEQAERDTQANNEEFGDEYGGALYGVASWTMQDTTNRTPMRRATPPASPPPPPSSYMQEDQRPKHPLPNPTTTATTLPARIVHPLPPLPSQQQQQQQQRKKRDRQSGIGMGISASTARGIGVVRSASSSKRMVSNFLRSRRWRNGESDADADADGVDVGLGLGQHGREHCLGREGQGQGQGQGGEEGEEDEQKSRPAFV